MGGGLEDALGCDLRIATPGCASLPRKASSALSQGWCHQRLPRIVGRGWGMEMMLTGEPIEADRALQRGLVTRLVESSELLDEARRMAEHLASFAPFVPRT